MYSISPLPEASGNYLLWVLFIVLILKSECFPVLLFLSHILSILILRFLFRVLSFVLSFCGLFWFFVFGVFFF